MTKVSGVRWKTGFLRLWVLAAAVWALAVLALGRPWEEIYFYANSSEHLSKIAIANDKIDAAVTTGEINGQPVGLEQLERLRSEVESGRDETERRVKSFPTRAVNFILLLLSAPFITLIFGLAISWVLAGFKRISINQKSE